MEKDADHMAEYEVRDGYYYTAGDTWVHKMADGKILVGITDYAQKKLRQIEYLNLDSEGDKLVQGESLGEIESKKSVSEMMSPLTGIIHSMNDPVVDDPGILNRDPYGQGWILEVDCADYDSQIEKLMDAAAYREYIAKR